jgi:hypothetical protein
MQSSNSPLEMAVINSRQAVEVLLDSRQREALLPFVGNRLSVSQAAAQTGESANTMLYRVRRWQRLGLLLEVGSTRHKTRTVRLYSASAQAFFVPYRATNAESLGKAAQQVYVPMFAQLIEQYAKAGEQMSEHWGIRFENVGGVWSMRPQKSGLDSSPASNAASPVALLKVVRLRLGNQQAKALHNEMSVLLQKYQHEDAGKEYQIVLAMAERP